MPEERWRVAVLGPGGVGGLVGAVLARAGHPVVHVAKPDTAAALDAGGLTVESPQFGDFQVPAEAVSVLDRPVDLCLVTVKATGLSAALSAVPAQVLGGGLVLPLLNGVDHMAAIRRRYPADQVVAGAIRVESTRVGPGRIVQGTPFSLIEIASATAPPARVDALAEQLTGAGLDVSVRDDETALLWDKLVLLAPLALLTTHAGAPAGVVRTERHADLVAMVEEVAAVAGAAGARVDPAAVLAMAEYAPAGMKTSMQRDAEAGRPIELDAIGGAVLRAGQRHGVPTPVTARIVAQLASR
jgi:2-dehydropantoate 2-reductase